MTWSRISAIAAISNWSSDMSRLPWCSSTRWAGWRWWGTVTVVLVSATSAAIVGVITTSTAIVTLITATTVIITSSAVIVAWSTVVTTSPRSRTAGWCRVAVRVVVVASTAALLPRSRCTSWATLPWLDIVVGRARWWALVVSARAGLNVLWSTGTWCWSTSRKFSHKLLVSC